MTEASARPAAATAIYRGMDRVALDAAYNNGAAVADSADWLVRWRELSAAVRASPRARLDIPYGSRPRARFDYFPCGAARAPLFVFIHGGYWQRNDKDMFAFLADGPRAHGIDVAVVGYTLAPEARLTDIVGEIRQALSVLRDRADEFGFDRDRLFVGGWSAGGHLTAIVSKHPAFRAAFPSAGSSIWSPSPSITSMKSSPSMRARSQRSRPFACCATARRRCGCSWAATNCRSCGGNRRAMPKRRASADCRLRSPSCLDAITIRSLTSCPDRTE